MNDSVEIPPDKLRYFCSNCGLEYASQYGTQRHVDRTDCKAAGGFVQILTHSYVIDQLQKHGHVEKTPEEEAGGESQPISQAEQAAASAAPPWATELSEENGYQPE